MDEQRTFTDVLIQPQYSEITSRSEVSLDTSFEQLEGEGIFNLSLPVFSANMSDVTGYKMAAEMHNNGGRGILHRYSSIEDSEQEFKLAIARIHNICRPNQTYYDVGVSVGVDGDYQERFHALYALGARLVCIDAAHGNHILMEKAIGWVKNQAQDAYVIAGNIATGEGAYNLIEWGADAVKVGIGPGAACTTRKKTGVGVPQMDALIEVRDALLHDYPGATIIADGGLRTAGDIAKALIYADAVMLGAVLAGTKESPGRVYYDDSTDLVDRHFYKVYRGSASSHSKESSGREARNIEGMVKTVPFKGESKYLLEEIREGIQSACSYVGASNIYEYKAKASVVNISNGAKMESKVHV